jgi:signal peptidase I
MENKEIISEKDADEAAEGTVELTENEKTKSKASEALAWVRDIIIAIIIALIISRFITPTIVQEHSMDDTLHNNDYLILWKAAYKIGEPQYGDIVVFKSDLLDDKGKQKLLIKRVVAKGGDTISLHDGYMYRNGEQLTEPYTKDGYTNGGIDETVVPEGYLFLMGDNRQVSIDSRDPSVGFVDEDLLIGKAVLRLFPFNQIGGLYSNYSEE